MGYDEMEQRYKALEEEQVKLLTRLKEIEDELDQLDNSMDFAAEAESNDW